MKNISKFIATLGVFAMTIGSGFAMDNNPPAEPVKAIVETEAVEEAPQQTQPKYPGSYYYVDSTGNAVLAPIVPGTMNCTLQITTIICFWDDDGTLHILYAGRFFNVITGKWVPIMPLYERTIP